MSLGQILTSVRRRRVLTAARARKALPTTTPALACLPGRAQLARRVRVSG